MPLGVAEVALVSPLGLSAAEHALFWRAEVAPHASGAFTTESGESLPIHDCPFLPASRPRASRLRLLAKQALARVGGSTTKAPVLVVGPEDVARGEVDLLRFLTLSGHTVSGAVSGSAGFVEAFSAAEGLLEHGPEVIVLAVDSHIEREAIERWAEARYAGFSRNPAPPSEGAAALRLVSSPEAARGSVLSYAGGRSQATDENDVAADGVALASVFGELSLPAEVSLVVGPNDLDSLRTRDFHLAAVRHHEALGRAEMRSLEGKVGTLGSAGGLMAVAFALASLGCTEKAVAGSALAWSRSSNGAVGAALVGAAR